MNIEEVKKEEMVALRRLSEIGFLISEGEAKLLAFKNGMALFLAEREKLTESAIQALVERSQSILQDAYANHEKVANYANTVANFGQVLDQSFGLLEKTIAEFHEYAAREDARILEANKKLDAREREIKNLAIVAESGAEMNRMRTKTLSEWQTRLHSKEQSVAGALLVLKKKTNNA